MKKIVALALALCMTASLAACGSSGSSSAPSAAPAASAASSAAASAGQAETKGLTDAERAKEFITVGTGPTSGIYFPIGGAFATALKEYGYQTSAEATNATGQNIQNILNGDCEIAIAMQDAVMQAYTATGAYEGKEPAAGLKALMRLWPNYVQLVTTADTGIKSVEDLKGKRVGVGAANSGVEINARMILDAYGITYNDITPDYLAYGEAIDNMKNGQCDAVFVTSGLPNATVMDLGVQYDMVIVPIDGAGRDKLVSEYPYYAKSVIPANTYNNTEDVEGVFVYNIMLVREGLSDAMVYDMLEGIFANIGTIKASHNAADKNIDITFGVDDIQLPLHPGAEAFWKDNGYIK
ncbi:TAXI family TRAP transporter solute-binding subunit [Dysosmobacter sp.]|uniref:TAXI family TRAP transporter solute-binding subunit n=1 Tax=Dysosmobacter sp. TaxID=2591382 RepID=UPI002A8DEC42|nr:TAXI family TRAP transporter solute-binding subunit [Dysosmobacter sp.]MDY3282742.1 TAXI family TRAP transporter solute-binding subunit [Dysosmobacter sp.]